LVTEEEGGTDNQMYPKHPHVSVVLPESVRVGLAAAEQPAESHELESDKLEERCGFE